MIVVDVETTGLDSRRCSIVGIGAVDLDNPSNRFYMECRADQGAKVEDTAMKIIGMTRDEVFDQSKPTVAEAVKAFLDWTGTVKGDRTIAGMNPSFDRDFLQRASYKAGLTWPFTHRTVDLFTACYIRCEELGNWPSNIPEKRMLGADAAFNYCGLPKEPRPHKAINGALYEAEAFYRLRHGKSLLPEFAQYKVPDYLVQSGRNVMLLRNEAHAKQKSTA